MVISYTMIQKNASMREKPTPMCGIFRDLRHFWMFTLVEGDRGRIVGSDWEILAMKETDVDA